MSQPNQPNQQQGRPEVRIAKPDDMLKVRVKSGKMLKQHITDGEDEFLETGAIVSVTRAFYDQHMRSRVFDSYHRSDGAILDRPEVRNDPTIELVEDPVEVHNKSISKAA